MNFQVMFFSNNGAHVQGLGGFVCDKMHEEKAHQVFGRHVLAKV